MGGSNSENIGIIVESAIGSVIARKQRRHVDVESEKIANRVVIFGAIQTMDGVVSARIRVGGRLAVYFCFKVARYRVVGCLIRPRQTAWRHRAGAEPPDHFLPLLSMCSGLSDIE